MRVTGMVDRPMWTHWACVVVAACALAGLGSACRSDRDSAQLRGGGKAFLAQCAVCHGPEGHGDGPLAASIRAEGKAPPAVLDGSRVAALGRSGVRRAIEHGPHLRTGSPMPLWGPHLGPMWMDRIAEYVVAMPVAGEAGRQSVADYLASPPGAPPAGRRVYVLYCSGCHGPQGGGDGFFAPSVAGRLSPRRIRGDSLSRLDDAELGALIGLGGAHAPDAETMPGWLYTISPDDREALVGYLRTLAGSLDHD